MYSDVFLQSAYKAFVCLPQAKRRKKEIRSLFGRDAVGAEELEGRHQVLM